MPGLPILDLSPQQRHWKPRATLMVSCYRYVFFATSLRGEYMTDEIVDRQMVHQFVAKSWMATPERVSSSKEAIDHQTLDPHSPTTAGAVPDLDLKDSPTRNDPRRHPSRRPSRRPHPVYRAFFAALDQAPVDCNQSIWRAVAGSEGDEEEEEEEEHLVRGIHVSTKREREQLATKPIENKRRRMRRGSRSFKNM